jgi:hypothetical protein
MKYSHWQLLLIIYQCNKLNSNRFNNDDKRVQKNRCNKTLIKTCINNGWVKEYDDGTVDVTEKGMEEAKEYAPLYENDSQQIGQTY